ncbi:hypothetical protein PHLCEN_2v10268 [Hermanssonia centrifuga]|uniref:Uncharacterized protein n=1 Tax=Hermanssonia centrifuga TaxID=98765 RepID=A0A2R6NNE0_9APHY|nr:hypothetical protein PHLCEN_2v10268 [Hermanssonia centrifuga]
MSTVTIAPLEEKVAVLDEKAAKAGSSSTRDYMMKFVCAAMSKSDLNPPGPTTVTNTE